MKLINLAMRAVAVSVLGAAATGCGGSSPSSAPSSSTVRSAPSTTMFAAEGKSGILGVFRGSERPDQVDEFERWFGHRVQFALDYVGMASGHAKDPWAGIDDASGRCTAWRADRRQLVLSVAMLPSDGQTLQAGAAGRFDQHWRRFARSLVGAGCTDTVLRLGWEFNARHFPWAAGGREEEFVAYWRRIVEAIRSVDGQQFTFEWSPLAGNAQANADAAYPGDDVVDVIGLDAYDTSTRTDPDERWSDQMDRPYGLRWHEKFAAEHRKPMSFPEWGVVVRPRDDLGGGDAPLYVERMIDWIRAHDVAYAIYFDVDASDAAHRLSRDRFPLSADVFLRDAPVLAGPLGHG